MTRQELTQYIADVYSTEPDTPWADSPTDEVFRHAANRKWFALCMRIPQRYLGIGKDELIDVLNMKCDPVMIGSLIGSGGFYPAYHMNKDKWISVVLDDKTDDEMLKTVLDISFELTAPKVKRKKEK